MVVNRPMRILWFVNASFPAVDKYLGKPEYLGTGWWMKATMAHMVSCENIEIAVAWASDVIHEYDKFSDDGAVYYLIPQHPVPDRKKNRILSRLKRIFNAFKRHSYKNEINYCVQTVNDFKPDLVHIWGTENFYGLISNKIDVPVLIRIQGLIDEIKDNFWGGVKWFDRLSMPYEFIDYIDMLHRAKHEVQIFKQNNYFEGRTFWDHSHVREHNVSAKYYDVPVMMRPLFFEKKWEINNIRRHSIYITARSMPAKGNDVLVKAVAIIKKYIPDIQLRIGGQITDSGYGKYLKKMVRDLGIDHCVTFLGPVTENDIIDELLNAHTYLFCSFVEGSCNSVIEAQLVGVPCVAAYVGGVTSLVTDMESGLFYPKGDSAMLAMSVRKIFANDDLALTLSKGARKFAHNRFSQDKIINGTLSAYKDIVEQVHKKQ